MSNEPGTAMFVPQPTILTLREAIASLGFRRDGGDWLTAEGRPVLEFFRWPPDVFAMAATVLRDSGAYLQAARSHEYPPDSAFRVEAWHDRIELAASDWRARNVSSEDPPDRVIELLGVVSGMAARGDKLHELSRPNATGFEWLPFLELLCIADHACRGVGLVPLVEPQGEAHSASLITLESALLLAKRLDERERAGENGAFSPLTLCKWVDPTRAIVLPKMRTSQRGVTIRSFSLHLALVNGSDVEPVWNPSPCVLLSNASRETVEHSATAPMPAPAELIRQAGPYNIIVLPYPFSVYPRQFIPGPEHFSCLAGRPPDGHAFFSFKHRPLDTDWLTEELKVLTGQAQKLVGEVHGLVMPEMSMTRAEFDAIFSKHMFGLHFVACGVYEPPSDEKSLAKNYALVQRDVFFGGRRGKTRPVQQGKHHRWALDASQVTTYSLGSTLRPDRTWWEGISLGRRTLHFFALDTMTAFTVLICEDLARPDPVADVVRAVGPNLVMCLLMDGPQLATRWSSRYATVLADDPGSSVLTLSSLGMVRQSRLRERLHEESRVIALWREPGGAPTELTLPPDADALLLSMSVSSSKELTLDGRHDGGMAATLRLAGVYPLKMKQSPQGDPIAAG